MHYIIINPASRSGKGIEIWKELEPIMTERDVKHHTIYSSYPGHIYEIVRKLCEKLNENSSLVLKIIVLGGDGTINEALQGVTDFSRVLLGYIPTGSSNDLARDLGYPSDPKELLDIILEGEVKRTMDMGVLTYHNIKGSISYGNPEMIRENYDTSQVCDKHNTSQTCEGGDASQVCESDDTFQVSANPDITDSANILESSCNNNLVTRRFLTSCGMGFDAAVCEEVSRTTTKKIWNLLGLGKLTYLNVALRQIIGAKSIPVDMFLDDNEPIHLNRFLFIAAMNHRYEGGGFKFCPDAVDNDNSLDLCVVGDLPKPKMLMAIPTAFKGKHFMFKNIDAYRASKIRLKADEPLWIHTDGEVYYQSDDIEISVVPSVIRFLA